MQNRLRKIEDEAWAKMSILLDKEMPQKKKKRRFILWFLTAATVAPLIAISTWWAMSSSNQASPLQASAAKMQSLDTNESLVESKAYNATQVPQIVADNATTISASISKPNHSSQEKSTNTLGKDYTFTPSHMPNTKNVLLDDQKSPTQKSQIQIDSNLYITEAVTTQDDDVNGELNSLREVVAIQAISSNNYKEMEYTTRNLDIDLQPSYQSVKRPSDHKSITLAMGAGARMMLPVSRPMPLLGLNVAYHLNKKWHIGTGLYYSIATQKSDSLVVAANYYGEYAAQLDKSFLQSVNNIEYSYIQDIILFDHKIIHIPIVIGYSFNKHLSLSGGIYYDKMISQRTNYVLKDVDPAGTQITKDARNVITNRIYSHNFNWMASIGYNISKKVNISFDLMSNNKFIYGNKSNHNAAPILQLKVNYNLANLF
jgi:hypothetical protein